MGFGSRLGACGLASRTLSPGKRVQSLGCKVQGGGFSNHGS
jgi:hypothetical protein